MTQFCGLNISNFSCNKMCLKGVMFVMFQFKVSSFWQKKFKLVELDNSIVNHFQQYKRVVL